MPARCARWSSPACSEVPDYSELVRDISVRGALQHIGGGVHRRVVGETEQRWIATLLPPATVADLLDDCRPNGVPSDAMHACVKPDNDLAVTCVAITANDPRYDALLDEVAAHATAAFLVEELLRSTDQGARRASEDGPSATHDEAAGR